MVYQYHYFKCVGAVRSKNPHNYIDWQEYRMMVESVNSSKQYFYVSSRMFWDDWEKFLK